MPTRAEMWKALGGQVDVLVVGGGIVGAGIARDAARRGLKVALVEMKDLAYGTSSRSSKLVHGGLRYLEQYEFSLVFEAVSERRVLLDLAPHLVEPLGFLFPVYRGSRHNLLVINAGMWLYDGLSLFRSPKMHRNLKPKDVAQEEPALKQDQLQGAPLYYDCSTDDARLTLENALDAAAHGAIVATWCKADGFLKDEGGRIVGAVVEDVATGERREVRAHAVVNATGPWTDQTIGLSQARKRGDLLRTTKGVHIVVDAKRLPVKHAVVCFHPTDERVLFAIPWGAQTYIGTTDTDYEGAPEDVAASSDDVDYLLDAANAYFPEYPLGREDVISTWAGLRPLIAPQGEPGEVSESQVSREHQVLVGQDGLITIAGGKLTTFRRMAAEVVDKAVELLRLTSQLPAAELEDAHTERQPLPGAVGWPEDDDAAKVVAVVMDAGKGRIPKTVARYLVERYGTRGVGVAALCAADAQLAKPLIVGRPEVLAQVDWSVNEELAATVTDFMVRRTQIFFRDADQGLGCAESVGARMQKLLGWTDAQRDASIRAYRDEVALSRRWREA